MKILSFLKDNRFLIALLVLFTLVNGALAWWDPMVNSRRFYKNDFTKTLFHHNGQDSGRVFFGNSAVTGAYMEDKSRHPLVEMGLSYGKITDLKEILQQPLYRVQDQLVIGIDVHTMLDPMTTDPTYKWNKKWYHPYLYEYRDYFKDSGTEAVRQLYKGIVELNPEELIAYQPRWIDKELYFGRKPADKQQDDWNRYEQLFNWMTVKDMQNNLDALDWVLSYAKDHSLDIKVVWMPYNPGFPKPGYAADMKKEVNQRLEANHIPVLDLMDRYDAAYFHDLVHLNREDGAPRFTKEVDEWLLSFAKPPKS